jgi:hypothetical protein
MGSSLMESVGTGTDIFQSNVHWKIEKNHSQNNGSEESFWQLADWQLIRGRQSVKQED